MEENILSALFVFLCVLCGIMCLCMKESNSIRKKITCDIWQQLDFFSIGGNVSLNNRTTVAGAEIKSRGRLNII